jgi:hypothetical protein
MLENVSLVAEQAVSLRYYFSPEAETNSRRYQKVGQRRRPGESESDDLIK